MSSEHEIKRWAVIFTLILAASSGCKQQEEQRAPEQEPEEDKSAVDKAAQLDPSLAKAVAAASAKAPTAQAGAPGGPPPKGIFGPGEADRQIKKGAPAMVTLGNRGQAPYYPLTSSRFRPGTKVKGGIQVAVQGDPRQGALPIDFGLLFEAKPSQPGASSAEVVARVESAGVGAMGVPEQVNVALKTLKGSRIEYQVAEDGAGGNFKSTLAPGAKEQEVGQYLGALNDALATITLPFPKEPVGTGAFWMATSREGVMGLDLVTYRLIRVQRAEPTQVTLTIETKRYAAGTEFDILGLQGNFKLDEFQSMADGTAMLALGQPLPHKAQLQLNLGALVIPENKPDERGTLQVQAQARFSFEDLQDPAAAPGSGSVASPSSPPGAPAPAARPAAPAAPATPPAAPAAPAAPANP